MPKFILNNKNFLFILSLFCTFNLFAQEKINLNNIEIARDKYGVPHIFSETNAEAIYGIGWAQCEDNFNVIQDNFAIAKGVYGRIQGKNGAILDFISQLFDLKEHVENRYEKDIPKDIEQLLQAYAQAVNRYAELHPKAVKTKGLFPLTPKEVLASYIFNFLVMSHAIVDVVKVADNKMDLFLTEGNLRGAGSNAMAYNGNITEDGKTYLVGNPHQPIDSPANFWEVSVHSKEGYEFFGATFSAGGITPFLGTNRKLGWTLTTNFEDYSDVYQLKMHPSKKDYYEYDGKWIPLETKKAKLKVKVGPLMIPVKKKYYVSKYGPTMANKKGYFAFRSNCFYNLKFVEQFYKMGLAQNYEEFWKALQIQGVPSQTVTYADSKQNIMHLSNGILPKRKEAYPWRKVVPGTTSEARWSYDEKYAVEDLVYVKNPKCGYVYNSNNTAMECTAPAENPVLANYPKSFGILTSNTARSKQFKSLISQHNQLSFQEIKAIRDNVTINKSDMSFRSFLNANDVPIILAKYPEFADIKAVFDKWDGQMNIENKQAAVMSLFSMYISKYLLKKYAVYENVIPETVIVDAFTQAKQFLLKHYNTLEVELGQVQRITRGKADYPMYGAPQTLANAYFEPYKKGKIKSNKGDSFIMYAQFGEEALESLKTINVFGNSNLPGHPHYTDQLALYVKKEVKEVELDVKLIKAKAVEVYHPE